MFEINFAEKGFNELYDEARVNLSHDIQQWERHIWHWVALLTDEKVNQFEVTTSGSTGVPKLIKHSRNAFIESAEMTCNILHLKQGNKALLCLPANKIGGIMMIVRSFARKLLLTCIKPDANPLSHLNATAEFDFAAFTPMQLAISSTAYENFRKADHIKNIILGGGTVNYNLQAILKKLDNPVYQTFGMTETISHIAVRKLNGTNPELYYRLLDGIGIYTDSENRLIINAPKLEVHNLRTNDLVRLINDKEFEWLGRYDNVINTGGIKVYPEYIEEKLANIMAVPYFISSVPDEILGQRIVLAIQLPSLSDADLIEIKDRISILDKHFRPKSVFLYNSFSTTETGKINRGATLANDPITTHLLN
jgi:O-succinylbenzoic acid--CoA ligase